VQRKSPTLEAMPGMTQHWDDGSHRRWRESPRAKLFLWVFVVALLGGLLVTALQPSLYQASATVLMTAPAAIDDEAQAADVQSVAIQRRILLGGEVTARLAQALDEFDYPEVDVQYLTRTLRVEAVADTNLVEMIAEGDNPELLPELVNSWIDEYLAIRAEDVKQSQKQTLALVRDQLASLEIKLAEARQSLADYREQHQISSAQSSDNAVMARLQGLNEALNTATENAVKAGAQLHSLENAIAKGRKVVPVSERDSVADMETELRQLKSQLKNLTKNYTMEYVRKQPRFRDIPTRIEELEAELASVYQEGQALQLAMARRDYEAAQQTVEELQAQLDAQSREAAEFTTIYATHDALEEDLARLEELNRSAQSRLVEVQVNPLDRYPQVAVIDRPAAEAIRIGPDYRLWLGGTALGALLLAILGVWLYGFLGPRQRPAYVTLSGVHMYPPENPAQLSSTRQAALGQDPAPRLSSDTPTDQPKEPD
tara:strand:- start:1698 stop:3152 length:1455 start_codon:yes stop_codon:yes gene_type:complete